jgi:L-ascorbate metabolism protein UlaG (beta-lactamase superfamily)
MKIKWLGQSAFQIKSNSNLVMDPYGPKVGELPSGLSADVVTVSHQHFDHNYTDGVSGNPQIIDEPGEFSIKGFEIKGVKSLHDKEGGAIRGENTIFRISSDGLTLCHLGDLGHLLTPEQIEEIGHVDILMIPVGGHYTIDANEAVQVVNQLNPKIVLPMHYKPENWPLDLPIAGVDKFTDLIGWKIIEQTDELEINESSLDSTGNVVVVFKK